MKVMTSKLIVALILGLSLGLVGCGSSSKKSKKSSNVYQSNNSDSDSVLEVNGDSDSNRAGAIQTVYFAFNSSQIGSDTRAALDANAEYLLENKGVHVQVEGHCDERGGVEYNLALGERRARAVKRYLTSMGVSSSRISTVSYGKERPIEFGHNESAWARNRRANFVVVSK